MESTSLRTEGAVTATLFTVIGLLLTVFVCGCSSSGAASQQAPVQSGGTFVPSLPVSHPPFDQVNVSWMQRLDEPYVYLDHYGSYTEAGALIPTVLRELTAQGLEASGPPFCLFYDDPAVTPVAELRARVCVPIATARSPKSPLSYDVVPSRTVTYAYVSGPYNEVPRAYPAMMRYMAGFRWEIGGPIREIYIVPPAQAKGSGDYLCEIQIPVTRSGG